jgi:hypothetical protein
MRRESLVIVIGVAVVAWGSLLWFKFSGDADKAAQEAVVVVAPPGDPSETANATGALPPAGAAALPSENEPADDGKGEILVTTRLSSIYGSPSPSAPVLYAFPAGRQLRVIGREGGFARIKDLQSGATGWADERILAPGAATAARTPATSAPSASTESSADGSDPAAESQPAATPRAAPRPSANQRAATQPTRPTARQRTAGQPPLAESDAPQGQPPKQAAKRGAQRAERQGPFPDFLKRAFGGR